MVAVTTVPVQAVPVVAEQETQAEPIRLEL